MRLRSSLRFAPPTVLVALVALAACEETTAPSSTPDVDGGELAAPEDSGTTTDEKDSGQAAADAAPPLASTCEGTCKTTDATAEFATTQPFDRAQFGLEGVDGGAGEYYVEAFGGGSPQCPGENTPDPDHVLILTKIPRGATKTAFTKAEDGITGALVDIAGDLLATPQPEAATSLSVTLTAVDPSPSPQWIAFDVEAAFPSGKVRGHFYGTRCPIFDR